MNLCQPASSSVVGLENGIILDQGWDHTMTMTWPARYLFCDITHVIKKRRKKKNTFKFHNVKEIKTETGYEPLSKSNFQDYEEP